MIVSALSILFIPELLRQRRREPWPSGTASMVGELGRPRSTRKYNVYNIVLQSTAGKLGRPQSTRK